MVHSASMCQENVHQRFILPGDLEAVAPVRERILAFLREQGCLPVNDQFDLQLVLQEALVNAVVHGCHNDPSLTVVCDAECDASGISLTIRDPGPGFDPSFLRDPTHGSGLTSSGGRGIYIIRSLMDEVRFEAGGSELHMRKNLVRACQEKLHSAASPTA